ncbi:hypothetical protein ACFGVS_23720 [Mucilaginibacter sp. AW1-7]|uniref:hypothetical protein n=1 Tax=Mucilaginibacter sp. AW1-7 TaxID=3349874 RepID=UPI003F73A56E
MPVIISVFALFVSGYNLYLSNFVVEDNLTARIVQVGKMGDNLQVDTGYIQIGFINSGNRDCMITRLQYSFVAKESSAKNDYLWRDASGSIELPMVLQACHMATLKFKIPMDLIYMVYLSRNKMKETNRPIINYVELSYDAIDSKGKYHNISTPREFIIKNTVTSLDTIYPIKPDLKGNQQYSITTVF